MVSQLNFTKNNPKRAIDTLFKRDENWIPIIMYRNIDEIEYWNFETILNYLISVRDKIKKVLNKSLSQEQNSKYSNTLILLEMILWEAIQYHKEFLVHLISRGIQTINDQIKWRVIFVICRMDSLTAAKNHYNDFKQKNL